MPDIDGRRLLQVDIAGTVLLLAVTILAGLSEADGVQEASLAVSGLLFLGGCVGFGIGFVRAAGRSREEVIDLAGLFYLTGSAPIEARRAFLGTWFAQIAIAIAAVPLTEPPFAVMAPVWGIGIITWWSSRYATFPARPPAPRR